MQTQTAHSYKLSYFNSRGFAEVSRLTMAAAGVKWEDVRFKDREEWLTVKGHFEAGKVPCLEVDGVQVSQSQAILRYLGREFNMYGEENLQKAQVDVVLDDIRDFRQELLNWYMEKDEAAKDKLRENIMKDKRPALVKRCEQLLGKNKAGSGYFVGSKLTIADITVFELFDSLARRSGFEEIMMGSKILQKHADLVKTNKGIADWLEKRPPTDG